MYPWENKIGVRVVRRDRKTGEVPPNQKPMVIVEPRARGTFHYFVVAVEEDGRRRSFYEDELIPVKAIRTQAD